MDFSKLDSNERLATFGAIAVVVAGLISSWGGLLFLAILAALGVLVVIFLPQFSPQTSLPGSKGSLMTALGIVAVLSALLTLLQWISFLSFFGLSAIMFLVALVGALVMAWAGWQELQSEGGKWQFGTAGGATRTGPSAGTTTDTAAPPPAPPQEPATHEPVSGTTVSEPTYGETATSPPRDEALDADDRRTGA